MKLSAEMGRADFNEARALEAERKLAVAHELLREVVADLDPDRTYGEPRCLAVRIFEALGMREAP